MGEPLFPEELIYLLLYHFLASFPCLSSFPLPYKRFLGSPPKQTNEMQILLWVWFMGNSTQDQTMYKCKKL